MAAQLSRMELLLMAKHAHGDLRTVSMHIRMYVCTYAQYARTYLKLSRYVPGVEHNKASSLYLDIFMYSTQQYSANVRTVRYTLLLGTYSAPYNQYGVRYNIHGMYRRTNARASNSRLSGSVV